MRPKKTANATAPGTRFPSGFSGAQLRKLAHRLDSARVHTKEIDGKSLHYIEGWYAVARANEIFGYGGWDRETVHFERVFERSRGEAVTAGYLARVRIRVRAGDTLILREGTGWGWASDRSQGAAHEKALKTAETDATKRALSTFGAQFGLNLYDKEQNGAADLRKPSLTLFAPDGKVLSDNLSAEAYCSGLRQLVCGCQTAADIANLERVNAAPLAEIRNLAPALRNSQGVHFADLLQRLMERASRRLNEAPATSIHSDGGLNGISANSNQRAGASSFSFGVQPVNDAGDLAPSSLVADGSLPSIPLPQPDTDSQAPRTEVAVPAIWLAPSKIAPGPRVDKSVLSIGSERRIRDQAYLKQIRDLPCTVCGRQPSHAHHLRFAQGRGLSQKVSDEYVVPLCGLHHTDLHRTSDELSWWKTQKIDPLSIAAELWVKYRGKPA